MASLARSSLALLVVSLAPPACTPPAPPPRAAAPPVSPAPPPAAAAATPLATAVDAYVAAFGKHWGETSAFHGYVAVARDGQLVFGKAYGKADASHGRGADADTRFRLGSITKSFTAVGILQLEERGALRIDDSIRTYLPELPPFADAITLRHCLTHTSGLPPIPDDPALAAETGAPHPMAAAFASYRASTPRFPPGERFEYSNGGFTLLAAILERVSGQSYEAYFREHVFGPAGMTRTTTVSAPIAPEMVVGYALDEHDALAPAPPDRVVTFGAGAILSTAHDLVAWDRALDGTRILGDAAKRRLWTPERDFGILASVPLRYGLGWFVSRQEGHEVLSHLGGLSGFETSFARIPDAGVAVVVLSNVSGAPSVVRRVAEAVQAIALTGHGPEPVDERVPAPFDRAQLASLAGDYVMDAGSADAMRGRLPADVLAGYRGLTLAVEGERLFLDFVGRPRAEVLRSADGALFTTHTALELAPEADGALVVASAANAGTLKGRYVRLTAAFAGAPDGACPVGMVRIPGGAAGVASFCIDATEVTVAAYAACARARACAAVPTTAFWSGITGAARARWSSACNGDRHDRQNHPVNCVDWAQASAYCKAQGKRLPTAAEWEWAARGGDQARTYPWGFRAPAADVCWAGSEARGTTCPVGDSPESDGRGGLHDLAGNVWEWTSTAAGTAGALRGGAWNAREAADLRVESHNEAEPAFRGPTAGFRCAK